MTPKIWKEDIPTKGDLNKTKWEVKVDKGLWGISYVRKASFAITNFTLDQNFCDDFADFLLSEKV